MASKEIELSNLNLAERSPRTEDFEQLKQETLKRREHLRLYFFFTGGIILIVGYFCMLSMSAYLINSYGPQFLTIMIFSLNIGGVFGFLLYRVCTLRITIKQVLIYLPLIQSASVVLAFVLGEATTGHGPLKTFVGALQAVSIGICNSVLHCAFCVLLFDFGHSEISFNNAGLAFAGILTTLVPILQLLVFGSENYFKQAIFYEVFQFLCTVGMVIWFYMYFKSPNCDVRVDKIIGSQSLHHSTGKQPSLIDTIKLCYPVLTTTILNYTIAMTIFPTLLISLGLGPSFSTPMAIQMIILTHNTFDLIGKLVYTKVHLADLMHNHYIALARMVFVAWAVYPFISEGGAWLLNNTFTTLLLTALQGITLGYLSSSILHAANSRVSEDHNDNAAFLSILSIFIGLVYGSMCNVFGLEMA